MMAFFLRVLLLKCLYAKSGRATKTLREAWNSEVQIKRLGFECQNDKRIFKRGSLLEKKRQPRDERASCSLERFDFGRPSPHSRIEETQHWSLTLNFLNLVKFAAS